jgi:hypothetical protein
MRYKYSKYTGDPLDDLDLDELIEKINHVPIGLVEDPHDQLEVLSPPVDEDPHQSNGRCQKDSRNDF